LRIKILIMAVVLAGLLFSLSASALTTPQVCNSIPITQLSWTKSLDIPKFDHTLGTLKEVILTEEGCGYLTRELDSEDLSAIDYNIIAAAQLISTVPGDGQQKVEIGTGPDGVEFSAGPDDEPGPFNPDWAGVDYTKIEIGSASQPECSPVKDITLKAANGDDLTPYIGNAGDQLGILVTTSSSITVIGSQEWVSRGNSFMGMTICVEYVYEPPLRCISGSKVNDCTGAGLPGWTINLKDASGAVISTKTTGADGSYEFCDLVPGSYTVCEVPQAGWKNIGDTCIPVTLDGTANVDGVDFSNTPSSFCISGQKFNDADGTGLAGWTINLKDAKGATIATKTTGADGSYKFCGLSSDSYTVCEVMQAGWKSVGPTCVQVSLDCADVTGVDFRNAKIPTGCSNKCPWHPVSELYQASCGVPLVVDAKHGILANDPVGSTVINPESITIDPKYGTLSVESDGSFEYDPVAKITSGTYVTFTYKANNGNCDSSSPGTAKIQVYCKR
jgi:hypothetical protein